MIAPVLVSQSTTDPGNDLSNTYGAIGSKLFIRIFATGNMLNSAQTQAVSLEAANSAAYFIVHVNGKRTTDLFSPGINNGSTWLTETDVQFELPAGQTAQQIITQVTSGLPGGALLSPNAAGYSQVINVFETAATVPVIQEAIEVITDELKENHAVLLRATQLGAVKSATYAAGELNS